MTRKKKDESGPVPRVIGLPFASGISLLYLLISGLWIFFSDRLAELFSETANQMRFISTYKGWFFVFVTSALLFLVLNRVLARIKRAQQQLCENEERLKIATGAGNIGIWERDILTDRLTWDERMYALYGIRKEDFAGAYEAWIQSIHPDDLERTTTEVLAAERGEKDFNAQFRIIRPDGSIRHIRAFAEVMRAKDGTPMRMIGINQDITEQVDAENLIQESQRKFSALLSSLPGMAYRCANDPQWTMEFISEGCEQLTGHPADRLLGNKAISFTELIHPDDRQRVRNAIQKAAVERRPYEVEYRITTRNGQKKAVWEKGAGQFSETGELICLEGFISDITKRKQTEEELAQFNKAAVGRELRMIELKQEINALCRKFNEPERFPVTAMNDNSK